MGLEKATRNAHEVARNTFNSTQKKMKRDYDVKILGIERVSSYLMGVPGGLLQTHYIFITAE
jgi:hypothetical protein